MKSLEHRKLRQNFRLIFSIYGYTYVSCNKCFQLVLALDVSYFSLFFILIFFSFDSTCKYKALVSNMYSVSDFVIGSNVLRPSILHRQIDVTVILFALFQINLHSCNFMPQMTISVHISNWHMNWPNFFLNENHHFVKFATNLIFWLINLTISQTKNPLKSHKISDLVFVVV